jgi:ABC-type bacteriocin/lantibiotic exporter with double-glycine peptidase domain
MTANLILRAGLVLCLAGAVGCTGPTSLIAGKDGSVPSNALYVKQVPFYPQTQYQCGPASLAAVLNYWGRSVTPEQITQDIYRPRMKGTLSLDLWQYAKEQDVRATLHQGSWEFLETEVRQDHPVIAFLNLGFREMPLGHFLVVVGLDPDEKSVIVYSGVTQNQRIPFDHFRTAWEKTNYWSLLIEAKPRSNPGA